MEYCITTNFDLFETVRIFSPWLLAFVVYLVWHWQKEKEVIANETKDILQIIDGLKASYTTLYIHHHLYLNSNNHFNEENFQKSKDENYKIEKEFTAKITFLLTLITDAEIYKIYKNFELNEAKFSSTQLLFEGIQDEVDFFKTLSERINEDLDQLKIKLVGYAMYKNKIKSRNRKCFNF